MKEEKNKYSGYGYHGGGRKATGVKRVSVCISAKPEENLMLKENAKRNGLGSVSKFVLSMCVYRK